MIKRAKTIKKVKAELKNKIKLIDFNQALRIFRKKNPVAKTWYTSAVLVWAVKKVPGLKASLEDWMNILKTY